MNFDEWSGEIGAQMQRKGYGFDLAGHWQSSVMIGLVSSEIIGAAQDIYRYGKARPDLVANELADALIRLGHFASMAGVRFAADERFSGLMGFNDLGDQQREAVAHTEDKDDFWFMLNEALGLLGSTVYLHSCWMRDAFSTAAGEQKRIRFGIGLRRVVIEICVFARNYGLDIDAAMVERIAYNETRPDRWNLAGGQAE